MTELKVFTDEFISKMKTLLEENTNDNLCITGPNLANKLGLSNELTPIVAAIMKTDMIPGYKVWKGPGGGIGKSNRVSTKKGKTPADYAPEIDDALAKSILDALDNACGGGQIVPRKKIAASVLGSSTSKDMNVISYALKRPEFSDFSTKSGKNGGIYKVSARPDLVKKKANKAAVDAAAPASAPALVKSEDSSDESDSDSVSVTLDVEFKNDTETDVEVPSNLTELASLQERWLNSN